MNQITIAKIVIVTDGDFSYAQNQKGGVYLEIKINREIRNYTESMFFGLSMGQFVFAANCA